MQTEINIASSKSAYVDTALHDEAAVRALVGVQQLTFRKARGSDALALMVASAYIAIRQIIANAPADVQAKILSEHGVSAAIGSTSKYTPWIKVQWGEHNLKGEKFLDSAGKSRTLWVPDRNMEIHHHTMESLEERGVVSDDLKVVTKLIMADGGSVAIARKRQRDAGKATREVTETVNEQKRELFKAETSGEMVDINIDRPDDMGEYMTILVRPIADCIGFEVMGIVDSDATAALTKLAKDQFAALNQRKRDRENQQRTEREIERRLKEQEERIIGGLNAEQRREVMARAAEKVQAAVQSKTVSPKAEKAA